MVAAERKEYDLTGEARDARERLSRLEMENKKLQSQLSEAKSLNQAYEIRHSQQQEQHLSRETALQRENLLLRDQLAHERQTIFKPLTRSESVDDSKRSQVCLQYSYGMMRCPASSCS